MSQERTRFPIQPDDRRRSARSSGDVKAVPDEPAVDEGSPQDKPPVPPHERDRRGARGDDDRGRDEERGGG